MAYPDDLAPVKWRVLQAIQSAMAGIATPSFHFDVQEAMIFESGRLVLSPPTPAIAIVPQSDNHLRTISCNAEEHQADISLVGALRILSRDEQWKEEVHWLIADMKKALADDPQLSGTCIYHEVESEDTYESSDNSIALVELGLRVVYRHLSDDPAATMTA